MAAKSTGVKRATKSRTKKTVEVRVVSDATGGLGRHMLTSVLTQFDDLDKNIRYHAFCDSEEKLCECLKDLKRNQSLVFSAVASQLLKARIDEICSARKVPHFDLTGGCVRFIEEQTGLKAIDDVDAVHAADSAYFERIDALEFSLQHDDSRRLESVHQAEIVLTGLSRVSKTPTSAYLGWLGHRVANVSIVPGVGVPKELKKCRGKAVGLTMRPKKLAEIRSRRLAVNGFQEKLSGTAEDTAYCDLRTIIREVVFAEQIYQKLRIPIIDTSELTIEETAVKVLEALGR